MTYLTALTATGTSITDSRNSIANPMIQANRAADQIAAVPTLDSWGALAAFLGLLALAGRKDRSDKATNQVTA